MSYDLSSELAPQWPGKAPETLEQGRLLWESYLRSLQDATDLRARYLEAQTAHAMDTMHVYRRVAELERLVSKLMSDLEETRATLRHVEGWVAGQGRRIATLVQL